MRWLFTLSILLGVALLGFADDKSPAAVKIGKFSAIPPADWKSEKPSNRLRSYQFSLPGSKNVEGSAELTVMPESDPKIEKVFPRWKAQFVPPEGKTTDDIARVRKIEGIKGATVDLLDVTGTWRFRERPNDPKSKEELKDDYRVIWVVISDGEEATHLRLSGPREVVDLHSAAFEKWIRSLK